MTPREVIAYLRTHPIKVVGNDWLPDGVSCGNVYAQYKRHFPSSRSNSVHYEVLSENNHIVKVVLHCESGTEHRQAVQKLLHWKELCYKHQRSYRLNCNDFTDMKTILVEIGNKMSLIFKTFNPLIDEIEERWGRIADVVDVDELEDGKGSSSVKDNYQSRIAELVLHEFSSSDEEKLHSGVPAEVLSVSQLLCENLGIPDYQRPYKWTEKSVLQLLSDMEEAAKNPDQAYRIGSVILLERDGRYLIVDGQQRVMTLALLSIALGYGFKYIKDEKFFAAFANSRESIQNLRRNFHIIDNYVQSIEVSRREALMHTFEFQLEVVVLKVQNESEAFQLFDCQNTRGRKLDPQDLLKAFHLREVTEDERKKYADEWEKADRDCKWPVKEECPSGTWHAWRRVGHRELFNLYFYRIYQWLHGARPGEFTEQHIDIFKGVPKVDAYEYVMAVQAQMGAGKCRYQINEPFYPGRQFFEMVETELQKANELRRAIAIENDLRLIRRVVVQDDGSQAHKHCTNLFYSAATLYYDRFGNLDPRALGRICAWAFMLRLDLRRVQDKSVLKYALGTDDVWGRYTNHIPMFKKIKSARFHTEIANMMLDMPEEKSAEKCLELRKNIRKLLGR